MNATQNVMSDEDGDGVYTATRTSPGDEHQYKFVNNTADGLVYEPTAGPCVGEGFGNDNRL